MRPVFVNSIALTGSQENSEVVIQFKHKYPESNEKELGVIETNTKTDDVASIVMSVRSAIDLRNMLNQMLGTA